MLRPPKRFPTETCMQTKQPSRSKCRSMEAIKHMQRHDQRMSLLNHATNDWCHDLASISMLNGKDNNMWQEKSPLMPSTLK